MTKTADLKRTSRRSFLGAAVSAIALPAPAAAGPEVKGTVLALMQPTPLIEAAIACLSRPFDMSFRN